jgi:4-hydroxy-tetrahydrodipicolinate reductase
LIRLLILGATGSMGKLISKLALEENEIEVVAACDVNNIGEDLANLAGTMVSTKIKVSDVKDLQKIIKEMNPEVVIDFSMAKATEINCTLCVKNKIRCVIGTTGLSKDFLENFKKLVVDYSAPSIISSNMATGVNIFFKIASILTAHLSEWDIEIIEAHHHRKVDSPSGTALTAGKIICETLGVEFDDVIKFGRNHGPNKRLIGAKNEIGIHAIRAGDIVGDHTIIFAGPGERIELKHQAHSRACMATGAIKAIKFIANARENKIYEMNEVLNL